MKYIQFLPNHIVAVQTAMARFTTGSPFNPKPERLILKKIISPLFCSWINIKITQLEKMLSLPFNYEEKEYYTLVRIKERLDNHFELRFTIMNAELQSMLCGDDKFVLKEGKLHVDVPSEAMTIAKLKIKIAEAVNNYFERHPLVDHNRGLHL